MKKLLLTIFSIGMFFAGTQISAEEFIPSNNVSITPELKSGTLTKVYMEEWDVVSGLFKWYRGAITIDSELSFEILPTYFKPWFFIFKDNVVQYKHIEGQTYLLIDPVTGTQVQVIPFQDISPLSPNYGRRPYQEYDWRDRYWDRD